MDTIVALSSGRLPAGVAIIRVSGPAVRFVIETVCGVLPRPREAAYRAMRAHGGAVLDSGFALYFPGPRSFTGEDVAEFHVHGGRAVVAAMLAELTAVDGVRHAEPGEFTRRAFLNGKLDLTETEALADLIAAETEAQRRFAVQNAAGAQRELYQGWRRRLIHARAMVEADIDFSDEEDIPGSVAGAAWGEARSVMAEIADHIDGYRAAEIIREGFDVVILGAPNSGKSSLFNALVQREAAIVTEEAGTTRDLLEVALDIGGVRVRLSDTAGIRHGAGVVETIGIARALERSAAADLVLELEDMHDPVSFDAGSYIAPRLRIGTKADLVSGGLTPENSYDLSISVKSGVGLAQLVAEIGTRAGEAIGSFGEVLPSRMRHVELLRDTTRYLAESLEDGPLELRSEALRLASDSLGRIAGSVDVEDLLDVIFSQFCIGK